MSDGEQVESASVYKREQKIRLDLMVVGKADLLGNMILEVYARGDEIVVYEIDGASSVGSIKVRIDTIVEDDLEPVNRYQAVKDDFDKFKSVVHKTNANVSYKHRAAGALTLALSGDIPGARELLCKICKEAEEEYHDKQIGRLYYLGGALCVVAGLMLMSAFVYMFRENVLISTNKILAKDLFASTFASIGGLISVSTLLKDLNIGKTLSFSEYLIYGMERIILSVMAGIVMFTLLSAKLIAEPLTNSENGFFSVLVFCFIAGFSEKFIPNILLKMEHQGS